MNRLLNKAQLQIHFCVLLWGFTPILGKLISLPSLMLVWWRMLIVVAALALIPKTWRGLRAMPWALRWSYASIGVLVSLHWLAFYGAIKLSNASVGASCIALAPVFLSFIEPWVARRRFNPHELLLGVAMVPGVALVVGGVPNGMRPGIWIGVLSAVLVALFSSMNQRLTSRADPLAITGIELGAGTLFLGLCAPWLPHEGMVFSTPSAHDALLLLLLALGCTLLPYVLALLALRHISAFGAQVVTNLEPVYAIALAVPLLGEQHELGGRFYLGVMVILGTVFTHSWLQRRTAKAAPESTDLTENCPAID